MDTFDNNQKKITAKRLKELRNGRRLSHESLSKELEKNKVHISVQALKDYEVTEENHSKFSSTKGMSIEKLYGLAKFYNVSADYLLGLTDIKDADVSMQACCEYTGLSEQALHQILSIKSAPFKTLVKNGRCTTEITAPDSFNENLLGICDNFISDAKFIEFLQKILLLKQISSDDSKSDLSESIPDTVINQIHNDGYFILNRTDFEQVLKFQISELCRDIVNDICESKVDEPPKKKRCRKATQKDFDTF